MNPKVTGCPPSDTLARAHGSTLDSQIAEHISTCARCRREWDEVEALRALAKDLAPDPMSMERQTMLRERLLVESQRPDLPAAPRAKGTAQRRRRTGRATALALAAALLLAVGLGLVWRTHERSTTNVFRGHILSQKGTRYAVMRGQPNEIVRLYSGKLSVSVDKLHHGERFRVVTGSGEVEVRGTAFDVEARDDRLVAVSVMHGKVVVRAEGHELVTLTRDQSWAYAQNSAPDRPEHVRWAQVVPALPVTASQVVADDERHDPTATHPTPVVIEPPAHPRGRQRARTIHARARKPGAAENLPNHGDVEAARRFDHGWQALRGGDAVSAAAEFAAASQTGSDNARTEDALFWQAVALQRAGRVIQAEAVLRRFLSRFSTSTRRPKAATMLGWLLYKRHAFDEARGWFAVGSATGDRQTRSAAGRGLRLLSSARSKPRTPSEGSAGARGAALPSPVSAVTPN